MKRVLISIFCCLCLLVCADAQRTCDNAYPITSALDIPLQESDTFWFKAWTYDLPLSIDFAPVDANNTHTPSAVLDFTCTPGVYDEPKLDEIFGGSGSVTVEMPYKLDFDSVVENDKKIYNITIGKNFRNIFTMFGINHDVQGFVKVFFPGAGQLKALPDSLFRTCISRKVELGDTIFLAANDSDRVWALPYGEWKNDSVRFIWRGYNGEALQIWLSNIDGNFNLSLLDVNIWDLYDVASGSKYKLTSDAIQSNLDRVDEEIGGGIFYARLQSANAGYLIVEKVPEFEPADGTIPLEYDKALSLAANDTNKVYYIDRDDWQKNVTFLSSASRRMHVYMMKTASAVLSSSDERVLAVYDFDDAEIGTELSLLGNDLKTLWGKTTDKYMYLRFRCGSAGELTATEWSASVCEKKTSARFFMNTPVRVANGSNSLHYLLKYDDFAGDSLLISWTGSNALDIYLVDTCQNYAVTPTNRHISNRNKSLKSAGSAYFTPEETAAWAGNTDADGWFYVRLTPKATGNVTFSTSKKKSDGADPVVPEPPTPPTPPTPGSDDDLQPLQPHVMPANSTIGCECLAQDLLVYVTEEQDLKLYDQYGKLVDSWHQSPSDPPHAYTPVCGVQYILKGKSNTVRIVR